MSKWLGSSALSHTVFIAKGSGLWQDKWQCLSWKPLLLLFMENMVSLGPIYCMLLLTTSRVWSWGMVSTCWLRSEFCDVTTARSLAMAALDLSREFTRVYVVSVTWQSHDVHMRFTSSDLWISKFSFFLFQQWLELFNGRGSGSRSPALVETGTGITHTPSSHILTNLMD